VIPTISVVAAALVDDQGRVLLAQRAAQKHQGGRWEFPGGKVDPGETPEAALARELHEELGVKPLTTEPLIALHYAYPDRRIDLRVWTVTAWQDADVPGGPLRCAPRGREGQALVWVPRTELGLWALPDANRPVHQALVLPRRWHLTPPTLQAQQLGAWWSDRQAFWQRPETGVLLRLTAVSPTERRAMARQVCAWARDLPHPPRVLLHGDPEELSWVPEATGVHLPESVARRYTQRPVATSYTCSMSCHSPEALAWAEQLHCDFAFLSPVLPTTSHPDEPTLGWDTWRAWVAEANLPVYALGGVTPDLDASVRRWGGQGVAGISAF